PLSRSGNHPLDLIEIAEGGNPLFAVMNLRINRPERGGIIHENLIARHAKYRPGGHGFVRNDEINFLVVKSDYFHELFNDLGASAGCIQKDDKPISVCAVLLELINELSKSPFNRGINRPVEENHVRAKVRLKGAHPLREGLFHLNIQFAHVPTETRTRL